MDVHLSPQHSATGPIVAALGHAHPHAMPSPAPLITRPHLMSRRFRVAVLGDIRVDVRTQLKATRFADLTDDHYEQASVETAIGGTAVNFARAAVSHFADVRVVAAVGTDAWTERIRATLARLGCGGLLHEVPLPNSPVVVVRDSARPERRDGTRLMVADGGATYGHLDPSVVDEAAMHILAADAVVVDGYALLAPTSAAGLRAATALAASAGIPVALDIVPHSIDASVSFREMRDVIRRASLVIAEAPTLMRLVGATPPGRITPEVTARLVDGLPADISGPTRTWFIRFGDGMAEETVATSPGHHLVHYRTGYAEAAAAGDVAGYGYRIAAAELKWWLTNLARADTAYPGVNLGRPLRRPTSR